MDMTGRELADNSLGESRYFDSDFHRLSQDLRTPLNAINGFAELLLMDEDLSPAHADYVRAILTGSTRLTETVVSYLDHAEDDEPNPIVLPRLKPAGEAGPAPRRSVFRYFQKSTVTRRFHSTKA